MEELEKDSKIEPSDIELTEGNKIDSVYHSEENKKNDLINTSENKVKEKEEKNITNQEQIIMNNEEQKTEELFPNDVYNFDSNKENNEKKVIIEPEPNTNNMNENLPQNNNQTNDEINKEEKEKNNIEGNYNNEGYNQYNDNNLYNQREPNNFPNEEEYINYPTHELLNIKENQIYPQIPIQNPPLFPPNNNDIIPFDSYNIIQLNEPRGIPPNYPNHIQPFPPHGMLEHPPFPPSNAPFPPHGPPQLLPHFSPHFMPPAGRNFPPHFGPQIIPSIGPHFMPPIGPQIIPPIGPHIIPPIGPHFLPPIGPHFMPPIGPHFMPHFGPHFEPRFGPDFNIPQPYYDYQNNNMEYNDDIGFNSIKGNIEINDNVKGDYDNAYNEDMQYYYEQNVDFRPNEFPPFPMNQFNYYENEHRIINNNINEKNKGKDKNRNKSEEMKSSDDIIKNKLNYKKVPLYIDIILPKLLISPQQSCFPKIKLKKEIKSFPIILIHNLEYYHLFIEFLNKSTIYKDFNVLPILKNKLIRPKIEVRQIFIESHFPKNFNLIKFADITDSNQFPIYSKEENESIINEIKKVTENDDNYFDNFMNSWINKIMNLMVDFVKFRLKYFSYYYYCNVCHFPCLYISDYIIDEFNNDDDKNKLIIGDCVKALNDLMEIIIIPEYKSENSKIRENILNVICYEEEYNYINYSFETEINGTFINCNSLQSLNKIMDEISDRNIIIQNKNAKKSSKIKFNLINNYMFELIISSIYVDKVFQYLINNNCFRFIKGICILMDNKSNGNNVNYNLLTIKKKYDDYLKDIYVEQNDVFEFLKRAKDNTKFRNNKKYEVNHPALSYINYNQKYMNIHKIISYYYNKYPSYSSQIFHDIILDFLENIDIIKDQNKNVNISEQKLDKKGSASKKQKINKIINIFKSIRENVSMLDKNKIVDININVIKAMQKYEQNLFLFKNDFNLWLTGSDNISIEKICYYIGSLMYNIDLCLYDNNEHIEINNDNDQNSIVLYKEFIGDYIDVLLHENNKYKIITFPYFLICSMEYNEIPKKDDDKYNIVYIIKYDLKNKDDYSQILFNLNDNTKVFQLFTFFKINDIKLKKNPRKALIYLEPINKKECIEQKLKMDDIVLYNDDLNIMDTIRFETPYNSNENFESINNDNLYITADNIAYNKNNEENDNSKITKYMQFFNNKYGTNLNSDMTSLSLEEIYMKNEGLFILSKTNLENLVVLNLSKNNISDISHLGKCNFPKLKKLTLESDSMANPQDKITDISPLMHSNFPELFILNLKHNLISDISYLLFMNFPNLIILDLSHNQIESVYVFNEVNFPNLETLDLSYNLITDITPFNFSGKKKQKQPVKNIDNSSIINSSNITNFLSKSLSTSEIIKKNYVLPSLKILKIKNNKIIIDEGYLMTVKSLRSRGITIFK